MRKKNYLNYSMEVRNDMDLKIIECYREAKKINITYYDNGKMNIICERITKIDLVSKYIYVPNKKILLNDVIRIDKLKS